MQQQPLLLLPIYFQVEFDLNDNFFVCVAVQKREHCACRSANSVHASHAITHIAIFARITLDSSFQFD